MEINIYFIISIIITIIFLYLINFSYKWKILIFSLMAIIIWIYTYYWDNILTLTHFDQDKIIETYIQATLEEIIKIWLAIWIYKFIIKKDFSKVYFTSVVSFAMLELLLYSYNNNYTFIDFYQRLTIPVSVHLFLGYFFLFNVIILWKNKYFYFFIITLIHFLYNFSMQLPLAPVISIAFLILFVLFSIYFYYQTNIFNKNINN